MDEGDSIVAWGLLIGVSTAVRCVERHCGPVCPRGSGRIELGLVPIKASAPASFMGSSGEREEDSFFI